MEAIVINKSQIDSREYSYHKLGNALRVLFVSDPQSAKVAVSLSVAVGTMNDPADCPGLAHYCEHMLFMGTHDHPAENAFDEFLSKNGGSTNADTEQNMTHYYFDCAATSLVPALELFTGFFVCPLFSQTAAVKEVDAIDAEGHGSKATLSSPDIRNRVSAFHDKHYSSNLMTAVIYGPQPVSELAAIAAPFLEKIPNKNLPSVEAQMSEFPTVYGEGYYGRLFKVVPTKMKRKLIIKWCLPCYISEYQTKPYAYALNILGHEGPNSLVSYLKNRHWATSIVTELSSEAPAFTFFSVVVKLTDAGEADWQSVAEAVFGYIKLLQTSNPVIFKYIIEENAYMSELSFIYKSKEEHIDYVRDVSEAMQWYPPIHILDHDHLYSRDCFSAIEKFNSLLSPGKADIFLLSKRVKSSAKQVHKPWGTRYVVGPVPAALMERITRPTIPTRTDCSIPPPNDFIPYSVPLKPATSVPMVNDLESGVSKVSKPDLMQKSALGEIWYLYDDSFGAPKTILTIKLMCGDCGFGTTPEGLVFVALYERVFTDIMNEALYMGRLAGTSLFVDFSGRGSSGILQIKSYSASLVAFSRRILSMLVGIDIDKHEAAFEKQREKYVKTLESFAMRPPDEQLLDSFKSIYYNNFYLPEQLLPLAQSMTFEKFSGMWKHWLKRLRYTMYAHGTVSAGEVASVAQILEETLLRGSAVLRPEGVPEQRVLAIPNRTVYVYIKPVEEEDEDNSTLISYFQGEPRNSIRDCATMMILNKFIEERGFTVLRAQEQLGYNVTVTGLTNFEVLGVLMFIESNKYGPEMLVGRIDAFVEQTMEALQNMKPDEYKKYVESAKVDLLEKDVKLKERAKRMGKEIFDSEFEYERKEKCLQAVGEIAQAEVLQYAKEIFVGKYRRSDIEIVSKAHEKKNAELFAKHTKDYANEKGVKRIRIDSLDKLRTEAAHFPDFSKQRYLTFVQNE